MALKFKNKFFGKLKQKGFSLIKKLESATGKQISGRSEFLIGITVLLIGSGAFLWVLSYGLSAHFSRESIIERTKTGRARLEHTEGVWMTSGSKGRITLQANKGVYQIIFSRAGSSSRYFSRGFIEAEGDYLIFRPSSGIGEPEKKRGESYYAWPMVAFAVQAAKRDGKLLWEKGPFIHTLPKELTTGPDAIDGEKLLEMNNIENPLFKFAGKDYIVWEPLN
jgi:hypothetical protein